MMNDTIDSLNEDITALQKQVRHLKVAVVNAETMRVKLVTSIMERIERELQLEIMGLEDIASFLPETEKKMVQRRIERIKTYLMKERFNAQEAEKKYIGGLKK